MWKPTTNVSATGGKAELFFCDEERPKPACPGFLLLLFHLKLEALQRAVSQKKEEKDIHRIMEKIKLPLQMIRSYV